MITTVAFDADHTLIDTDRAARAGVSAVLAALAEPRLTIDDFWSDATDCWAELVDQPAPAIRAEAMRRTLARVGRESEVAAMVDLFFQVRYANSHPFPEVLETLGKLRPDYVLIYATNANSDAYRCGLAGQFSAEIYALRPDLPKKPSPAFYTEVARQAGVDPREVVHVGDNYLNDIVGPAWLGMRTIWVNRTGEPTPQAPDGQTWPEPDAVVDNLMELPRILATWR